MKILPSSREQAGRWKAGRCDAQEAYFVSYALEHKQMLLTSRVQSGMQRAQKNDAQGTCFVPAACQAKHR